VHDNSVTTILQPKKHQSTENRGEYNELLNDASGCELEMDGLDTIGSDIVVTPPSAMINWDESNEGWDLAAIFTYSGEMGTGIEP
jgi:hypothetical protein